MRVGFTGAWTERRPRSRVPELPGEWLGRDSDSNEAPSARRAEAAGPGLPVPASLTTHLPPRRRRRAAPAVRPRQRRGEHPAGSRRPQPGALCSSFWKRRQTCCPRLAQSGSGAEAGTAPGAAAPRPAQRHGGPVAGAAESAGLGGPGGAAGEDGQVRGCERGPGRAARLPAAGAGRLRAVAAGQVPGGGPESRGAGGRCVRGGV